ncbi:MAG: response regulator [Bacteroidia bacterium]
MTKKINVLLLDNSERITFRIEFMLLNNKIIESVKIAHTIGWAKEILREMKTDVVILDIKFSDGDGMDFLSQLKKSYPKINLVVLTNHADDYHKIYAKKLGANYFIDKSMAFQEIPNVLTQILSSIT